MNSIVGRSEMIEKSRAILEKDMELLGVTGVEDR